MYARLEVVVDLDACVRCAGDAPLLQHLRGVLGLRRILHWHLNLGDGVQRTNDGNNLGERIKIAARTPCDATQRKLRVAVEEPKNVRRSVRQLPWRNAVTLAIELLLARCVTAIVNAPAVRTERGVRVS